MGLFGDELLRLLREKWPNPTMLAEEIYAILNSTGPLQIDGPVTINNSTDQPALTIRNFGDSTVDIQVQRPSDPSPPGLVVTFRVGDSEVGGSQVGGGQVGGATITIRSTQDGGSDSFSISLGGTSDGGGHGGGDSGSALIGQVVSGSGDTYEVDLFENGPARAATRRVTVKQLQIAEDETIPAGTWQPVSLVGGAYYMQCPVWLDDTK